MLATVLHRTPGYTGGMVLGDGTVLTFVSGQAGPTTITFADAQALTVMGYAVVTTDSPSPGYDIFTDQLVAPAVTNAGSATSAALRTALVSPLPTVGSLTYNGDGTIASDADGNTYTWNADGTPHTQTKGGVTRTYTWNADGTLASVA